MTCQVVSYRMSGTTESQRLTLLAMAAEFTERVGKRILAARLEMELTKAEVARRMLGKVDGSQIARWEKGLHMPSQSALEELARVLERDVSYFLVPEPEPGVGDLLGALVTEETQLDRIERKLDEVLRRLEGDEPQEPPGDLGLDLSKPPPKPRNPRRTGSRKEPETAEDTD